MVNTVKRYFFTEINDEVQAFVDKKSLDNLARITLVIMIFEAIALCIFLFTRKEFDHDAWVSIRSASTCLILCGIGAVFARVMQKKEKMYHGVLELYSACYYLLLSLWAVSVAYRNYCVNEQFLTFFAVQILMVCFLPMRPAFSMFLAVAVYVILYSASYSYDGAKGLNIFNYVLILLVTITGMVVRFRSEVRTAEQSVELAKSNDMLFYNTRHDGLTGLRNRKALEEDVPKMTGKSVIAYMIDINYFKEVNDTYGHAAGDAVLKETSGWIKKSFEGARCYRYGGDEFLVLSTDGEKYKEDTYSFSIPEVNNESLLLSIGHTEGTPGDHDELFELISKADEKLYEVKRRTHSVEFGGHGER